MYRKGVVAQTETREKNMLERIKGGLIVSCQALADEPLYSSFIMGRMALAAKMGGAVAIRANTVSDINEIKKVTDLPVIGLIKRDYSDSTIYITPTLKEIDELLTTSCEIIATDATGRKRPGGSGLKELVDRIHEGHRLAMADVSTFEEAVKAQDLGFDLVSTTLSGYTDYSPHVEPPDYRIIRKCVRNLRIPVIAEGRISTVGELKKVLKYRVFAVVIGSAITRPQLITKKFSEVMKNR
jgi:N-acylglucosamine-6-phosphate 2-epimerase